MARVKLVIGEDRVREDGVSTLLRNLGLRAEDLKGLSAQEAQEVFDAVGLSPPDNGLVQVLVEISTPDQSNTLDEGVEKLGGKYLDPFLMFIPSKPQPQASKPGQKPKPNPRRGTKIGDARPTS